MTSPRKILYLGSNSGTSKHRADALVRLEHQVEIIDPWGFFPQSVLLRKLQFDTGMPWLGHYVRRRILRTLNGRENNQYDLVIVNCGELINAKLVKDLRAKFGLVANYNNDDPFGKRDRNKWKLYLEALPHYDLVVVVREVNVQKAYASGAKKVLRVFMTADEVVHHPRCLSEQDYSKWASDVLFIGTWMPERGEFMARLIKMGIPLSIYGSRWQKAPQWSIIKNAWRGGELHGDNYAKAIQSAKICLGLLSKGNRDLHTTRSIEIPALGGLLCAERTLEHQQLYQEGKEAIFWSDAEECAAVCKRLISEDACRANIALAGKERAQKNNLFNEAIMQAVLKTVDENGNHSRTSSQISSFPTWSN
ncbi:MAG: glycosyltransferase [Tildeniella nuda ZEHNDER 1965/U140]|jgi:spore maturation protein CgeB|nr:glycosyltransferase [Tildeniella nuda ZEHNDER 1965/U140]